MKKLTLFIVTMALTLTSLMAQVAVNSNGDTADYSAMLDVSSTTRGMLIPRMTTAQRNAISWPAQGLMVYDTDDSTFYYYKKTSWIKIGKGASGWDVNGNYIYTLNDSVGIGTSTPTHKLHIKSTTTNNILRLEGKYGYGSGAKLNFGDGDYVYMQEDLDDHLKIYADQRIKLISPRIAINRDDAEPDNSAILDVNSDSKGMLIPRMTTAQRNAISSPATGLLVFDTDKHNFYYYNSSGWTLIKSGVVTWQLDSIDLTAADTTYHVGIGTSNPEGVFEVATLKHNGSYGSDMCSGGTASASSHYTTYTPDRAFDDQSTTEWLSDNSLPAYLQYDFGAGNDKRIAKYEIYYNHPSSFDHSPNNWTFEASNDGSTWTTLDTQTGQGWSTNGWQEYTCTNTTRYRYYRLYITDNKGTSDNYVQINEMQMMEENLSNDATLYVNDNKVGIGTSSPSATLEVSGSMKLTDGNEASGKVLVSDASGNATWTDGATVNGGGWTVSGNHIYNTNDSVGIGTSSITERLTVDGGVTLGNATGTTTGTIRWNSTTQDFEGYNGTNWVSLSKTNGGWGNTPAFETEGVVSSDGAGQDEFGCSVSIDGDYAIVGAHGKTVGGNSSQGKAYIFHRSGTTWSQQAPLTASDGVAGDHFGYSVSISGDYAIVGAEGKDVGGNSHQGKAYIFHRSGTSWGDEVGLTASDGAAYNYFGVSVSIDGDYAVVGARGKVVVGNSAQGKAYIFHRSGSTWSEGAGLTASDGAAYDYFGRSVTINGNYAIVGAYDKDVGGNNYQGKAYIFHRSGSTWSEGAGLTASDGAEHDYFGRSVSINGNYAIVGAYEKDVGGNNYQGKVYFFNRN